MSDATRDERVRNQPQLLPEGHPPEQHQRRNRAANPRRVTSAGADWLLEAKTFRGERHKPRLPKRRTGNFREGEAHRLTLARRVSLDVVRIECARCGRAGSYRRDGLTGAVWPRVPPAVTSRRRGSSILIPPSKDHWGIILINPR
jgi:hypothetical protein